MIPTLAAPAARKTATFATLAVSLCYSCSALAGQSDSPSPRVSAQLKLDHELSARAAVGATWRQTRLIVQLNGKPLPPELQLYQRAHLDLIDADVLEMPDRVLNLVAQSPDVASAHFDRAIWAADYLSTRSVGADVVWDSLAYTGRWVGVCVIDSGITDWHDHLTMRLASNRSYPHGNQRGSAFVDFVNGQTQPYDDHGHGSHVAGIILGNGYDAAGKQSGIAPDADLVALKVL